MSTHGTWGIALTDEQIQDELRALLIMDEYFKLEPGNDKDTSKIRDLFAEDPAGALTGLVHLLASILISTFGESASNHPKIDGLLRQSIRNCLKELNRRAGEEQ